jgi:hypothetical protein
MQQGQSEMYSHNSMNTFKNLKFSGKNYCHNISKFYVSLKR